MTGRLSWLRPLLLLAVAVAAGRVVTLVHGGSTVPWGLEVGYGLVFGSATALTAVGLVLIYRAARVINFSQAAFGANAAILFLLLDTAEGWDFWLAAGAAVAASVLVGFLVELLVLRRFASSPRLVLTLITVVLVQVLDAVGLGLPWLFGFRPDSSGAPVRLPTAPASTPFGGTAFKWGGIPFNGNQVALVVTTLVLTAALTLFLRRSRLGTALRGASENSQRVEQLGISSGLLSSTVWVLVVTLSAIGGILAATAGSITVQQSVSAGGTGLAALMSALAAAVFARLDDLPMAFAAAVGLTIFEQGLGWAFDNDQAVIDIVQFGLILLVLLLQRARSSRTDPAAASSWVGTEEIRGVPAVLAHLAPVQAGLRRVRWVLAVLLLGYPFVVSAGELSTGTTYAIFGAVGVSLVVLTGWAGQVSLGQFAFVAVGSLTGGVVISDLHLPFLVALLAGTLASAIVAVIVGLPALRVQGLYLAVTTLALAVAVSSLMGSSRFLAGQLPSTVDRPSLLGLDTNTDTRAYFYLCVLGTALVVWVATRMRRSRTGRVLIAMRDNERMAQAYGIHLVRARLLAFALSGGMAGFAGVLYGVQQRSITGGSYGPSLSIEMFLLAVMGGLGSVSAVLAGAVYLGVMHSILPGPIGTLLSSGLGVLVVMLLFPAGLGAMGFSIRDAWLRRIAQRYRLYVPSLAGNRIKRGEEALIPMTPPVSEEPLPTQYVLDSQVAEFGRSQQLAKAWRY